MDKDTQDMKLNYYANIPMRILCDNNLMLGARLIYGLISGLCSQKGYCWATNSYFAALFEVSKQTVSNWITQLRQSGYIIVEIIRDEHTNEVDLRKIWIVDGTLTNNNIISNKSSEYKPMHEPAEKEEKEKYKDEIKEIIDYLNNKIGTRYRYTSETNNKHIRARLNEKFTVDDFKKVIDNKTQEWTGTEFQQYLRPETLFGTKFEQYLNQTTYVSPQNQTQRTQWDGTIIADKAF